MSLPLSYAIAKGYPLAGGWVVPSCTVAPAVTGTLTVGQTLSCSTGTVIGVGVTFTYQWVRVESGYAILNATSSTYVLTDADFKYTLACIVTATNTGGAVMTRSNALGPVGGYGVSSTSGSGTPTFTFTAATSAIINTDYVSNTVTVANIASPNTISIIGGSYSINGLPFTTSPGTIHNGDTLALKLTASPLASTQLSAAVTINSTYTTAYNVTTAADIIDQLSAPAQAALALAVSSRKLKGSFAGAVMPVTGTTITAVNDQSGNANNLTPTGSPQIDTGGINGNSFATMDGTSAFFTFGTAIALTGDFDIFAAIGIADVTATARSFLGKSGTSAPYLRVQGTTNGLISSRSDGGANVDITPTANWKAGWPGWRWKRVGSTLTVYLGGTSVGTATVSGTCTFNTLGMNQIGQFLKGGWGECFIFNGVTLSGADETAMLANMAAAWRSAIYVDPVSGLDTNAGWNTTLPFQTLATARTRTMLPGQRILLKSGATFARDQLYIAQANAAGTQAAPVVVDIYGGTTPALLDGAEAFTSGWTNVSGDVWNHTGAGAGFGGVVSPAAWIINGTAIVKLDNAPGGVNTTFGSLTQGQSAVSGTTLQICMPTALTGTSPNSYTVKHAQSVASQSDDNIHASNLWWTFNNLKSVYAAGDGNRLNGAGTAANFCISWYNAADGFGQGNDGSAVSVVTSCDSQYNGSGDTSTGSLGDGFSAHGLSAVTFNTCTASHNDKSSFNHEESTTIVQNYCTGMGANLALNYLNQPGTNKPGDWTITGGSYARKAGSAIKYVVGALSTNNTHSGDGSAGGGKMTLAGVTLIDPEGLVDSIGYYAPSSAAVDVTSTGTTFTGIAAHANNNGIAAFSIA